MEVLDKKKTTRRYSPEEIAKRTARILKHSFPLNGGKISQETKKKMSIAHRRWNPDELPKEKPCNKCKLVRKREEYYGRKLSSDGKHSVCIHCKRQELYGISEVEYMKMREKQNGLCSICGGKEEHRELAIDHDHKTGKVRGLLCGSCNLGIGKLKNLLNVENAIKYLRKYE